MSKKYHPHDGVAHSVIQTLEHNLQQFAVNRRCLAALVMVSANELVTKIATADEPTLNSLIDLLDVSEAVIQNLQSYVECLQTAQARLLNAFIKKQAADRTANSDNRFDDEVTT